MVLWLFVKHSTLHATVLLAVLAASPVFAATFQVTRTDDDDGLCDPGDCALREAILAANANPGPDVVEVPVGTYQLSLIGVVEENNGLTGDLDVLDPLEIRGEAPGEVVIIGDGTDRVIQILNASEVTLSNLTITGGNAPADGGGVYVSVTSLRVFRCTIEGNRSHALGGGLWSAVSPTLIVDSTISNNFAAFNGGGVSRQGVGFSIGATMINSTVSNNTARNGGGIQTAGRGDFELIHSTVADNVATNIVDGILIEGPSRMVFENSLIVNNNCGLVDGLLPISNGGNLESPGKTCFLPDSGDQEGVPDALLGPLADNGGPTKTHALLSGSPARDAAVDADCEANDQRGLPRPFDGDSDGVARCDIGAFEARLPPLAAVPALGPAGLAALLALLGTAGVLLLRRKG